MGKIIYEKEPQEYNEKLAKALKEIPGLEMPGWGDFVKTGNAKERPPEEPDWWYKRMASILRQLYIRGVVGVGRLRTRYGSRKNRGAKPDRFRKASGKIIRIILQQAEAAGLVEKITGKQWGRRLTQHGRKFLDDIEVEKIIEAPKVEEVVEKNIKKTKSEEVKDGEKTQQKE